MSRYRVLACLVAVLIGVGVCHPPVEARAPQSARERYDAARTREADVREQADGVRAVDDDDEVDRMARLVRRVVIQYEGLVRRFPTSGYSDNALFQAATLSQWLHGRYAQDADRAAALKYFAWLEREYPASPLRREARAAAQALTTAPTRPPRTAAVAAPVPVAKPPAPSIPSPRPERPALLQSIDRTVVEGRVRVTLTLDRETPFAHELLATPPRAFVDLAGTLPSEPLRDAALRFETDAVRQVRVGRRAEAVRVVMDLAEPSAVSVFTLYNPFRVVIDAEPSSLAGAGPAPPFSNTPAPAPVVFSAPVTSAPSRAPVTTPAVVSPSPAIAAVGPPAAPALRSVTPPASVTAERSADAELASLDSALPGDPTTAAGSAMAAPVVPSANADGTYSLARQLGLGVSRIVIDPGHGGHDPGTLTSGSTEARLVLDVALRLEKLLEEDGFDVVLTRRTDVFVPLEERTAIANREGADLFLSIHANSGRDPAARGVEVYYLSFASNPDAEAVAARENTTAAGAMHNLPSMVRAIALNNKLDESRDFAQLVQRSLATRLAKVNVGLRNRGVKKAPFVVLIGANMPSVLAEIGFITNKQEAALIKSPAYRQRIAESLQAAVGQYQRTLKRQGTVATR